MKDRIREMAKHYAQSNMLGHWKENDIESFARLIIEECAKVCDKNAETYEYSFTPARARLAKSTSLHCSNLIRAHFGIDQ